MVKQPFLLLMSLVFLIIAGSMSADDIRFLFKTEKISGVVTAIKSQNTSCAHGKPSYVYDCTRFRALTNYEINNVKRETIIPAGFAHHYNQPVSQANFKINDSVVLRYDPAMNTTTFFDNSFLNRWMYPVLFILLGLGAGLSSFMEPRYNNN